MVRRRSRIIVCFYFLVSSLFRDQSDVRVVNHNVDANSLFFIARGPLPGCSKWRLNENVKNINNLLALSLSLLPLLWIFDQCGHEPIVIGKATDCIQNEGDLKWWIACIAHLRAWFVEEHITISLIWRKNLIFYDKSTKVRHLIEQDHLEVRENWWRLKNHAKIMFDEVLHENVS